MKIKSEFLSINRHETTPDGTKVEPEQQPAARIIETEAAATLRGSGAAGTDGQKVGALPARFIFETTAGEAAQKVRTLCAGCKHFRRKAWNQFVDAADSPGAPMERRMLINEVRFAIESQQSEEVRAMHTVETEAGPEMDVEHALRSLGFCGALSEHKKDQIIVHPLGSCPTEVATKERPHGFYEPKSLAHERKANIEYDNILKTAAGK